jgi:preprotein translocase subunit SecG
MPSWAKWATSLAIAVALISLGWKYLPLLMTLHIAVCFVLVVVIMLQSGSAADLAGAFGGAGSQTAFGPRGAATFLSRATTWCAIVFMMTSLALSVKRAPEEQATTGSILEQTEKAAPAPAKPAEKPPLHQSPGQGPLGTPPVQSAPAPSAPSNPVGQAPAPTPAPKK